ncbi:Ribosome biogenesis protein 1 [Coelomomyces lativittatus]|nr:Ribosome biogenesis protein 1 [Coelomomyces lativittatus]
MDDPTYWKSVYDELNKKNIVLTEKDLEVVHRLHQGHFADPKVDPYPKTIEWFTSLPETMPLSSTLEPKRRFLPSKWEAKKIAHLVRALKNQPQRTQKDTNTSDSSSSSQETSGTPSYFDLWNTSTSYHVTSSSLDIPPPKLSLPGHADSYHPPPEYLIKPNELVKLQNEHASLDDIPQRFSAMRLVPAYEKFIQERFQRCLDLYLCPRVRKNRIDIDPESLIPKLPDPEDLEPFPKQCALTYVGHTDFVRSVSYSPTGQYFISGSEDQTVRLWDALRGRCLYVWTWNAPVTCVAWNPNKGLSVIAVAVENEVYLIHVGNILNGALFNGNVIQHTTQILQGTTTELKGLTAQCEWKKPSQTSQQSGGVWLLRHHQSVTQIHWHNKGDYFTTVVPKGGAASVFIHQLSRKLSQQPFKNNKGIMVQALFHPTQPLLCIATQRLVRIYDLTKKQLTQKLTSGVQWISSMAIHPSGQHVIVGSYCKRLCWWDTDLSSQPYKTLRYHTKALRSVHFHPTYPLFASSADDGCIQIFHGQVYKDLFSHPLIVPLKILKGHRLVEKLGVLSIQWHPHQPWLLSAGADHSLKLWV